MYAFLFNCNILRTGNLNQKKEKKKKVSANLREVKLLFSPRKLRSMILNNILYLSARILKCIYISLCLAKPGSTG